jgi:hypothetical protein
MLDYLLVLHADSSNFEIECLLFFFFLGGGGGGGMGDFTFGGVINIWTLQVYLTFRSLTNIEIHLIIENVLKVLDFCILSACLRDYD